MSLILNNILFCICKILSDFIGYVLNKCCANAPARYSSKACELVNTIVPSCFNLFVLFFIFSNTKNQFR